MEQPEISNKRPRHADIEAHSGLKEPVSKRSINRNLQNTHETTTPSDAPRYVDSGINLTRVAACTEEENIDTVALRDVIGDENLQELYQFNFTVDLQYLMDNLNDNVRSTAKITVIHGMKESASVIENLSLAYPNVAVHSPRMMDRWGVHHSKCMVLFCRKDNVQYIRIAIVTANICHGDWNHMCQATYRTPLLKLKTASILPGLLIGSEHGSPFERDLLSYFRGYHMKVTDALCEKLQKYDFSNCKAVIIASVPGYHQGDDIQKWGLKRLQHVLTKRVDIVPECRKQSIILTQSSSVGKFTEKWYNEQFAACMRSCRNPLECTIPQVKFIYPTIEEVCQSFTGLESAGFLRMDSSTYQKLHSWFPSYLCKWNGRDGGRERAMPHYKSYTRLRVNHKSNSDSSNRETEARASLAWHLVTSANLSRAAWGDLQKNSTQLHIRHYELGVLIYPDLWEEQRTNILATSHRNPHPTLPSFVLHSKPSTIVPVRIPYGLPPKNYTNEDHCWTTAVVDDG